MKYVLIILCSISLFLSMTNVNASEGSRVEVTSIHFEGLGSTKRVTLEEILPRSMPTTLSQAELTEYVRRVKNLGIFDTVSVEHKDKKLLVKLSRKNTYSPILALSTGKTDKDISGTLGLNQYDFLGTATKIGGEVSYSDRSINLGAWITEHRYRNHRWTREIEVYKQGSSFRFEDESSKWSRSRLGAAAEWISPFKYDSPFLYEFQLQVYKESFKEVTDKMDLEESVYYGALFEIIYDRYSWDDVHPSGFKGVVELRPGVMDDGRFRGEFVAKFIAAKSIYKNNSLVFNGRFAAVNEGDVNHSLLIGSKNGVRGIDDSLYRTSSMGYINIESRHSMRLGEKLYFQPVIFADSAMFREMDSKGESDGWTEALSLGTGVRLIPTHLTNFLFRLDVARVVRPTEDWFVQLGIKQYF